MSEPRVIYELTATRPGRDVLRARIGPKPFLIGSGSVANLRLDDPAVLPIHARVLLSSTGQLMVHNLGEAGLLLLDGDVVVSFTPALWKPGALLELGGYTLNVTAIQMDGTGEDPIERVRPALVTQESDPVPMRRPPEVSGAAENPLFDTDRTPHEGAPHFVIDWGMPIPEDTNFESMTMAVSQPLVSAGDTDYTPDPPPAPIPPAPLVASEPLPLHDTNPEIDEDALFRTEVMPVSALPAALRGVDAPRPAAAVPPDPLLSGTLPKDWREAFGRFAAQLPLNPARIAANQRSRIPLSLRSESGEAIELRIRAAGIARDWLTLPERVRLQPGEIIALDIIVEPPVFATSADVTLLFSEREADEPLALTLVLDVRSTPNIDARLEPSDPREGQQVALVLHNHTLVELTLTLSGHSDRSVLDIQPSSVQLTLPAGQGVNIPVDMHVKRRAMLRTLAVPFALSVRQGTRAPLDVPGTLRVRPRSLTMLPLLVLPTLIALLVLGSWATGLRATGVTPTRTATPSPTVTSIIPTTVESRAVQPAAPTRTLTPSPTVTHTPTRTVTPSPSATRTPTATRTPSPTPTETPFADPRPQGCAIDVPEGWVTYTVRTGDRVFRLAVNTGTTVDEVARVNCLRDPRLLQVGQELLLPSLP